MNTPPINRLILLGLLAVAGRHIAPRLSGAEGAKSVTTGAAAPASRDVPLEGESSYAALSPADRLGIKFSPPPKETASTPAVSQPPDPSPDVIVLAPFVVIAPRLKLTNEEVATDREKVRMAERKYLSPLYRGTFGPLSQLGAYYLNFLGILGGWHPNEAEAMALYRDDKRSQMLSETDYLIRLETLGQPKDEKQLLQVKYDASTAP